MDKSTHTAAYDRLTAALKKAREDAGLTQQQVAERLEVYASWLSKVEAGERRIDVVELAVEKGASIVLMPVSARKQLFDLSDDMATKVNVLYFTDAREAFIKALSD